jgi:hypothetical protein
MGCCSLCVALCESLCAASRQAHLDLRVDISAIHVRVMLLLRARQLADQQQRVDQQPGRVFAAEQPRQDAVAQAPWFQQPGTPLMCKMTVSSLS